MRILLALIVVVLLAAGCDRSNDGAPTQPEPTPVKAEKVDAAVLTFEEQEEGVEPYPLRMIVTKGFLRMDDGPGSKSYLLYDRATKVIYNVNADDRTVLVIEDRNKASVVGDRPALEITDRDTSDMPTMKSQKPVHKTLGTAGKRCYDVVAIPGLMPDVVEAMRGYLLTLSSQQAENIDKTPEEMRDPCMMVNLIHYPARHLDFGFPLREWDYRGFVRELVDFGNEKVDSGLFTVTSGYRRMTLDRAGLHKSEPAE